MNFLGHNIYREKYTRVLQSIRTHKLAHTKIYPKMAGKRQHKLGKDVNVVIS